MTKPASKLNGFKKSTPVSVHQQSSSRDSTTQRHSQHSESLLGLYSDNFCLCQSASCRRELTSEFQRLMKEDLCKQVVQDLIHMLTGSSKSAKLINFVWYFLQYMSLHTISKELMDDILRLFVVLYLKGEAQVKATISADLEHIFMLVREQQTTLFVEGAFKYRIFFHDVCQFRHCLKQMETGGKPCELMGKGNTGKRDLKAKGCSVHGNIDIKDYIIDLSTKKTFIPYICFLAQLNFKILNIEEGSGSQKEMRRKLICNILFSMMRHCKPKHFYYPLRALAEFFKEQETEKALSKRLNAESLLYYKKGKEIFGREVQLYDFRKLNSNPNKPQAESYSYLYGDTLSLLRVILSQLDQTENLDCHLLCLQIVSFILAEDSTKQHLGTTLYVDCLVAVSQHLTKLNNQEKERYYSCVKSLMQFVKGKVPCSQSKKREAASVPTTNFVKVNGKYIAKHRAQEQPNTAVPPQPMEVDSEKKREPQGLAIMTHLLTLQKIQAYPKLARLVFEQVFSSIEFFNNEIVSFIKLCQENRILVDDFCVDQEQKEQIRKRNKLCDGGSAPREIILNYYSHGYSFSCLDPERAKQLSQLQSSLSPDEIIFSVDFLLEVCKSAQVFEDHAITLGTHLLCDFYQKSGHYIDRMLEREDLPPELLFVNFDLRAKAFEARVRGFQGEVKDEVFNAVFVKAQQLIAAESKGMERYTAHFLKHVIRIFQGSRRLFNLGQIKQMLDEFIAKEKLVVMVNALPLYLVQNMFFDRDMVAWIHLSSSETRPILAHAFECLLYQVCLSRSRPQMLHFYRVRNLINSFSSLVRFLLCFKTPFEQKTSSSLHSSQSLLSSQAHGSSSFDPALFEQKFIVKRQKRCNFCGEQLQHPKKFCYSRKCRNCAGKNSCFVFPARFLCNMCVDASTCDLFDSGEEQIPLDTMKDTHALQSDQLLMDIQNAIAKSIEMLIEDTKESSKAQFYFHSEVPCLKKAQEPDNMYSYLTVHLANRMLKVMRLLIDHDLPLSEDLLARFAGLQLVIGGLTDMFALTKERVQELKIELELVMQQLA